jgi:hypothetical protein
MANETSRTTAQVRNIRLVPSDTVNRDHTVSSLDLSNSSEDNSNSVPVSGSTDPNSDQA